MKTIESEVKTNNYVILSQGINYNMRTGKIEYIKIECEFMAEVKEEKKERVEI